MKWGSHVYSTWTTKQRREVKSRYKRNNNDSSQWLYAYKVAHEYIDHLDTRRALHKFDLFWINAQIVLLLFKWSPFNKYTHTHSHTLQSNPKQSKAKQRKRKKMQIGWKKKQLLVVSILLRTIASRNEKCATRYTRSHTYTFRLDGWGKWRGRNACEPNRRPKTISTHCSYVQVYGA